MYRSIAIARYRSRRVANAFLVVVVMAAVAAVLVAVKAVAVMVATQ